MRNLNALASKGVSYLVLTAYLLISLYPFLWMASASVRSNTEVLTNPSLIPNEVHFDVILDVWNRLDFWKYFVNSFTISAGVVLGIVFIYSLAGYGFAKTSFWGRDRLYLIFLGLLVIPQVTILVPLVQELKALGFIGRDASHFSTSLGLILPMINGGGPFAVFLFRSYFASLPDELRDAARIDGCNEWEVYLQIFFPLALPAIATVAILNFISSWNAYIFPSVVLSNPDWFTLPLQLRFIDLQTITQWNVRMAGALITVIPVILAFLIFQRYFIRGLTAGAVKG